MLLIFSYRCLVFSLSFICTSEDAYVNSSSELVIRVLGDGEAGDVVQDGAVVSEGRSDLDASTCSFVAQAQLNVSYSVSGH